MLTFKLDSDTKFEFSMQIMGDAESSAEPEILFAILDADRRWCFRANYAGNGQYVVIIPAMKSIVTPGVYKSAIWVFIGDRFYKPHESDVEFKAEIRPVITGYKASDVKPPVPSVSVPTPPPTAPAISITNVTSMEPAAPPTASTDFVDLTVHEEKAPAEKPKEKAPPTKDQESFSKLLKKRKEK